MGNYEKARELWNSVYMIFYDSLVPDHPDTKTHKEFLNDLDKKK